MIGSLIDDNDRKETLTEKIDRLCHDLCTEIHRLAFQPITSPSNAFLIESLRYDVLASVNRALSLYLELELNVDKGGLC